MEYIYPCSDHSCIFQHGGGEGVNGGCHCLDNFIMPRETRNKLRREIYAARGRATVDGQKQAVRLLKKEIENFQCSRKNDTAMLKGVFDELVSAVEEILKIGGG